MDPFLSFKNIKKSFGKHLAVDIDQLEIKQGEIISILGPSGCGKTTLLRLLAGLEIPDEGVITLSHQTLNTLPPNKRKINTVFQSYALFPHLSVRENIAFGLRIQNQDKQEIQKKVDEMLSLTQLSDLADQMPTKLSGGQKQRVAIARALVMKPKVLLLDEPLAALDLKLRQRMLLELDLIHDEVGITFIFITHDQNEAMSISDRIAVMNNGRIEQVGTPKEIYETPKSSFVAAFIGDTNFLEGELCEDSAPSETALIYVEGLGRVSCFKDQRMTSSKSVYLSIRPEKFHISKKKPECQKKGQNVLKGVVDDVIYLGSHTKYWVNIGSTRLTILQQHHHFITKEEQIAWEDEVWISWEASDGFMIERFEASDKELLESPNELVES